PGLSGRLAPFPTAMVVCLPAGIDSSEEDVGRPVLRLRRGKGEDRGEAAAAGQPGQPLVLADIVVGGQRGGPQIGGPGDMDLPPGPATVMGMGEPDIC